MDMTDRKTHLTPDEKLRAAYAYLINDIEQHHIASLFGVNSGRIAETVMAVRAAVGMPEVRKKPKSSEAVLAPSKLV